MARILILEDNYVQAAEIERVLLDAGHEVIGLAPSSQLAFALAESHPPDLLICDLQLALGVDGVGTAAELRRLHGCKVLIVTGYPEVVTSEIRLGHCGLLQKPFSDQRLLDAVKDCLPHEAAVVPNLRDPSSDDVVI